MGALADFADLVQALEHPNQALDIPIAYTTGGSRMMDGWTMIRPAGSAPGAAAVPAASAAGSIRYKQPASGNQLWAVGGTFYHSPAAPGLYLVCDRLSHQSGLSGTVTTAQTTNLPTAALTRYTGGDGVFIGLTIYTAVGTTATTVSATYTNQAGTGSRVTPLVVFGGTAFRESERLLILPLQEGDTGVRSVQSVTVTATTGTAGNFGVTLFKPIGLFVAHSGSYPVEEANLLNHNFPVIGEILPDACLVYTRWGVGGNVNQQGSLFVAER